MGTRSGATTRALTGGLAVIGFVCLALAILDHEADDGAWESGRPENVPRRARAADTPARRGEPSAPSIAAAPRLVGFVHDAHDGRPISGARVLNATTGKHLAFTDHREGRFTLTPSTTARNSVGTFPLRIEAEGFPPVVTDPVDQRQNQTVRVVLSR